MQPFIAGPLLGCTVKDDRHGTALGHHQLLKPVVERCFDALVLQCQAVVKVEDGEGGVVHVLRPVIGCSSVQRTKSLIVQHGSANVPNQMLDLHVVVARGPSQQCTLVQLANVFGFGNGVGRQRTREQHHVVKRFQPVR